MSMLTLLPLRPDGVRATVEFIFSVHPSSTVSNSETTSPQKQGANITQEALNMATRLLANPPASVTEKEWFSGIAPQLFVLLEGGDGFDLTRVAAFVIGYGILGRKKFGAPGNSPSRSSIIFAHSDRFALGAVGWSTFAEPMLATISPPTDSDSDVVTAPRTDDEVLDLSKEKVLVRSDALLVALHRLQALVISHPNPGLTRRLVGPLLVPLWTISSWVNASPYCEENFSLPARNLLKIYLRISTSIDHITTIIGNLLYDGPVGTRVQWRYTETTDGGLQIVISRAVIHDEGPGRLAWQTLNPKSDALVALLESISTDDDISSVFLELLRRWLTTMDSATKSGVQLTEEHQHAFSNPEIQLVEGTVLQKMMQKFPEKLAGRSEHILELVKSILEQGAASVGSEEDEAVTVALSLLNLVVTIPGFQRSKAKEETLQSIEISLAKLSKDAANSEVSSTSRNLSLFLRYRDQFEEQSSAEPTAPTDRQVEDRKTYNLALSYITQADSPPPVRSEGLNLIQGLILANSSILDIPATLVLMSSLLDDKEDYINLRVVKIFTQLADRHPKTVTKELLERYLDAKETTAVDTRLRFGEALLQVIERLGETFTGDVAEQVGETLLSTAGRRGRRPKTEAKQAREARMRDMKLQREADKAQTQSDSESDMDVDLTEEEKTRNEILGRIVEGWGSKQGAEDVRIRASALSVLGAGIETNIAGLGATIVSSAVDLSVNVLTLETEPEKAIVRRSAIILILSFVRALDRARESGRRLGFGLTQQSQDDILRVLKYVAVTDDDGLVKQHARDVIESLEAWKMTSLLPTAGPKEPTIARLAGLSVNPDSNQGADREKVRPKIEEIE